jgi:ribosomal protein S6
MVCYRVLCLAKPATAPKKLAKIFQVAARVVYREKGQFRTVENLGVRPLQWPIQNHGQKFEDARWVQFWCDVSPAGLQQLRNTLTREEDLLGITPLRALATLGEELGEFRSHRRLVEKKKYKLPTEPNPVSDLLK